MSINNCQKILLQILLLCFINQVICQEKIPTQRRFMTRIAFGSCSKFYRNHDTDIFRQISEQNADVFVWLGDFAYTDEMVLAGYFIPEADEQEVRRKFNSTYYDKNYQKLKNTTRVIGTWDDHDYGKNNKGIDFEYKDRNQQIFLDYMDEPEDSPRRKQKGLYTSYFVGEHNITKVILPDGRYWRDYKKRDDFGKEQWKWIEKELSDQSVQLFILGFGVQVLPDDRLFAESLFPETKERLYKLINKYNASVLLLSGDIHMSEFLHHPCSKNLVGYDLVEATSSGLTMDFDHVFPGTYETTKLIFSDTYSTQKDRYPFKNYGIIDIMFSRGDILDTSINIYIFGKKSLIDPVMKRSYKLRDFKKPENATFDESKCYLNKYTKNERMVNNFSKQLIREIKALNWKLYVVLSLQFSAACFILLIWKFLFQVVTGQYGMQYYKDQQKILQKKVDQLKKKGPKVSKADVDALYQEYKERFKPLSEEDKKDQ